MQVRIGSRRFRPTTGEVRPFVGAGLSGGYGWYANHPWNVGLFIEPGVAWFPSPSFSLGASVDLRGVFVRYQDPSAPYDRVFADLSPPRALLTFYW